MTWVNFFSLKSTFLKIDLSLLSRKADSISHSIQRYCEVITVHVYHFIKKCYSLNCLGLLSKEFASELAAWQDSTSSALCNGWSFPWFVSVSDKPVMLLSLIKWKRTSSPRRSFPIKDRLVTLNLPHYSNDWFTSVLLHVVWKLTAFSAVDVPWVCQSHKWSCSQRFLFFFF